jgi:hypothetical protein
VALGALVALSGGEVWAAANASPARQAPPPAFSAGETVDWLQAHGVGDAERLLSLARPEYVPASEGTVRAQLSTLAEPLVESVLVAQKWHDTLTPNVPLQFGLNTADGYDGGVLPLLRWLRLSTLVVQNPRPDGVLLTRLDAESLPDDRTLDLLGVRYLIANAGTPGRPELQTVDFGDLRLFVRSEPVPRSLLVFGATTIGDDDAALQHMAQPTFDSNQEVVLAAPPAEGVVSSPGATGSVRVELQEAQRWRAHVALSQPGYLLQREAWYPGWRAYVDGHEAPVLRADVLFRAVALGPGEHDVEFVFDSASFDRGALLSGLGILVGCGLIGWPWLSRRFGRGPRRVAG